MSQDQPDRPFTVCDKCGQPHLTTKQEGCSLIVFFDTEKDRAEFKRVVVASIEGARSYDY